MIRDTFKRGKYQDVILPLTVLRRLDCVLAGTKEKVLAKQAQLKAKKLGNPDEQLLRAAGQAFYNTSKFDFERLLQDASSIARNLRNYVNGFSANMREVSTPAGASTTSSRTRRTGRTGNATRTRCATSTRAGRRDCWRTTCSRR